MDNQQNPQSLRQKIINSIKETEEDLSAIVEINGKLQTLKAAKAALEKSLDRPSGQPDTLTEDLKKIQQAAQKRDKQLQDVDATIKKIATEAVDKTTQDLNQSGQA